MMEYWFEGRLGRGVGAASFGLLVLQEVDFAAQAGLINPANEVVWRWRIVAVGMAILAGFIAKPPVSFMSIYGGGIFAFLASVVIFAFYFLGHWANTGGFDLDWSLFPTSLMLLLPVISLYWFLKFNLEHDSPKEQTTIRVIIAKPLASILGTILTILTTLLVARVKYHTDWFHLLGGP